MRIDVQNKTDSLFVAVGFAFYSSSINSATNTKSYTFGIIGYFVAKIPNIGAGM